MPTLDEVTDVIKDAIKRRAQQVFDESQEACPVKTGRLKRSGSFTTSDLSADLEYSAPYASLVEDGIKEGTKVIGAYATSDGRTVSAHTASYRARQGRHFIQNAVDSAESDLVTVVDAALNSNFKVQ